MCTPRIRSVLAWVMILTRPFRLSHAARPSRPRKGIDADAVINPARVNLLFRQPHTRHFGRGINHRRDGVIVHFTRKANHAFNRRHPLSRSLMRQHRSGDEVPDGIDRGNVGAVVLVDQHLAVPGIEPYAHLFQPQPAGERSPPHRYQETVADNLFFLPFRFHHQVDLIGLNPAA